MTSLLFVYSVLAPLNIFTVEQLIPCTTTLEPVLWSLGVATTKPTSLTEAREP